MIDPSNDLLLYRTSNGAVRVRVLFREGSFWMPQKAIAELFAVKVSAISKHLKNIFESGELEEDSAVSVLETTADGKNYKTRFYSLEAIKKKGEDKS